jgi:pimeloyl-ACP methyl ester carboxylesterase
MDATGLLSGLEPRLETWRGARLRVFEGGAGPPVLLLHGYGGAAWNFAAVARLLPGRRLIVPDLPGHGGSAPLPAAPTLSAFADAVAPLLDGPADVVGHSLGAVVGLRLAARRPDLVENLMLAAPAGLSSGTRTGEALVIAAGIVQPGRRAAHRVELVVASRFVRRLVFNRLEVSSVDFLDELAVRGFLQAPVLHTDVFSAGRALVADDPRRYLDGVAAPTVVLLGARDALVPRADGLEYARRLGARLRVIADCGHLLIGERPDACARAILDLRA